MSDLIARLGDQIEAVADCPAPLKMAEAHETLAELAAALRQKELDELADEADLREMAEMLRDTMKRAEKAERELAELRAQQPPREPTPEMIAAVTSRPIQVVQTHHLYGIWRAMYDAAPPAQQPKAE